MDSECVGHHSGLWARIHPLTLEFMALIEVLLREGEGEAVGGVELANQAAEPPKEWFEIRESPSKMPETKKGLGIVICPNTFP